jgi:hypothetical protein
MIKRMLSGPALLPSAQKATLWIAVVLILSIAAFTAESMGITRTVAIGIAAILIAPLAWGGAWLFTVASRQPKHTAVKVARA